jgi:hypothetical protein
MQGFTPTAQQDCMAAVLDVVVLGGVNADYLVRATSLPQPAALAASEVGASPSLPYRPAVQRLFEASAAQPTASTLTGGR